MRFRPVSVVVVADTRPFAVSTVDRAETSGDRGATAMSRTRRGG
ncbi:MAG TPA: hypothetical protein VH561_16190 [Micromonosporaceae bacterium]